MDQDQYRGNSENNRRLGTKDHVSSSCLKARIARPQPSNSVKGLGSLHSSPESQTLNPKP